MAHFLTNLIEDDYIFVFCLRIEQQQQQQQQHSQKRLSLQAATYFPRLAPAPTGSARKTR
jgi:hypothetical protein